MLRRSRIELIHTCGATKRFVSHLIEAQGCREEKRAYVKQVVAREALAHLHQRHSTAQQQRFDRRTHTACQGTHGLVGLQLQCFTNA